MKKASLIIILLIITCFLASCDAEPSLNDISNNFDTLASTLGGSVIVYKPAGNNIPDTIISLYGRAGETPDELKLVDYALIWYSDRMVCADLSVFHAVNATDTDSIVKMCKRRANTVKSSTGAKMKIYSSGHFVCAYTDGIPELEAVVRTIAGES